MAQTQTFITLSEMLTKEPEILQTGAFCEHAMQQNAPWTPLANVLNVNRVTNFSTF